MDEHDWLTSTDAATMLAFVAGRDAPPGAILPAEPLGERKLRLFLVGCCRQRWELFTSPVARRAVETVEAFADGLADDGALGQARKAALRSDRRRTTEMPTWQGTDRRRKMADLRIVRGAVALCAPYAELTRPRRYYGRSASFVPLRAEHRHLDGDLSARSVVDAIAWGDDSPDPDGQAAAVRMAQIAQAELLRCVVGDPFRPGPRGTWPDATVERLARWAYDERAFDQLPVLADALEDAGCADAALLSHLRGPGPHVRGCWAVDVVLGLA